MPSDPNLLRDLSRSASRHDDGGGALADLMRLAADPLLLHEHLSRRYGIAHARPEPSPPLAPNAVIGLAAVVPGGPPRAVPRAGYERQGRRIEPSVQPVAFSPSPEDQALALQDDSHPSETRRGWIAWLFRFLSSA